MENLEERFIKFLRMNNQRVTPERLEVVREILKFDGHFDVDTLLDRMKNKEISRATLYRTVNLMYKGGLLRDAAGHGGRRVYEHVFRWRPHGHFVCVNCGKGQEFEEGIIEFIDDIVKRKMDTVPLEYRILIRGWCTRCVHKNKKKNFDELGL
jgi:Fur family ferric uptake transcriptional regulator